MRRPEIFVVDQRNKSFNKLVLNPVITDSFCIQLKQKVFVNVVLIHKMLTGTAWLVMTLF